MQKKSPELLRHTDQELHVLHLALRVPLHNLDSISDKDLMLLLLLHALTIYSKQLLCLAK